MTPFKNRLDKILDRLTSEELLSNSGLGNEIDFYIFDYPPEFAVEVRGHIQFILRQLPKRKPDLRFTHNNLFDLILVYLKNRNLLDRVLDIELKKGNEALLNSLKGPLDAKKIAKEFIALAPKDDLLDAHEDLLDLQGFFNNQKQTWEQLQSALNKFLPNKTAIGKDEDASTSLKKMEAIISAQNPYSMLKEVNFPDHGLRVLSNPNGSDIPEILEHATEVDLPGLDKEKVLELRLAGDKDNELYRMLVIAQCNALHKAMPFLFDEIDNEAELLLPDNLLHTNSPVKRMVSEIDENLWDDVEILGWIYQFYISEKKDEVIGKVVKSEDIPAATQLFTPNWIVKYDDMSSVIESDGIGSDDLFNYISVTALENLKPILRLTNFLTRKYDCVITDPPYMGTKGMNRSIKLFLQNNYAEVKSDLFSTFIVRNLQFSKHYGNLGFMTPFVWMFLSSYEDLRIFITQNSTITSLTQLEYSGFEGATVPICCFTLKKIADQFFKGGYIRLSDFRGSENQGSKTLEAIKNKDCGWWFEATSKQFKDIHGSLIAYWVSNKMRYLFKSIPPLKESIVVTGGMTIGNNDRFLRLWYEVASEKAAQNCSNRTEAIESNKKWFPYNKGGPFSFAISFNKRQYS